MPKSRPRKGKKSHESLRDLNLVVRNTSNFVAASANSFPFLIPAHPLFATVVVS